MDVYKRVCADKSVRSDAHPNVPGPFADAVPRGLACDTRSHGSQLLAVRNRMRFAIARAFCSQALAISRGLWSHAATQACRQVGHDDLRRVVVEH